MTNDLMRDVIEGRTALPLWRSNFLMGITGPNRIAILPTTDPWLLALQRKQHLSHGPDAGTLKERGRVNKYKTKG